ncbi:MAG TPA: DUF456 domain-containing protein [Acidimicrobiales bacterium]|nr:DUF456 domain-containing protein [Acidimicrobiales bacterium]
MLVAAVAIAIAVGVAGTVVPMVPGLGLIVVATLVYGVVDGFGSTGTVAAALIVAIGVAGTIAGVAIPKRAAGAAGAQRSSLLIGALGAVIGFFAVPVIGLPLGGVAGIYVGERLRTGDGDAAWRATRATVRGFGLATLAQLAAALVMAVIWVVWVLF